MRNQKKVVLFLLFFFVVLRPYFVFAVTAGDSYEVYREISSYKDSYSAKIGSPSTGIRPSGTYIVYKVYNDMLNLSKQRGVAGFWMNPKENQPVDSTPIPPPTPIPTGKILITDRFVSMRSGPSNTFDLIKTLAPGTEVVGGEANGNYTAISLEGVSGYVYTKYLKAPQDQPFQKLKITGAATFRKGPGTNYSSIGNIPKGTIVFNREEFSGTFIKVSHNGTSGWISSYYIDAVEPVFKQGIIIANKKFPVPSSLVPGSSDDKALFELKCMCLDYRSQTGRTLENISGYRSYDSQRWIFEKNAAKHGFARANTYSARPGYSEHQTGLAFDVNGRDSSTRLKKSFKYTKEYKWLIANAHKYGFILRYPEGKSAITGYIFEPWHYRYVGPVMAKKVRDSGLCLEEYLSID